jgi:hypothetical protein
VRSNTSGVFEFDASSAVDDDNLLLFDRQDYPSSCVAMVGPSGTLWQVSELLWGLHTLYTSASHKWLGLVRDMYRVIAGNRLQRHSGIRLCQAVPTI